MRIPRARFGPSRTVFDPDGRLWTIRVAHFRLPRRGEEVEERDEFFDRVFDEVTRSPRVALFAPIGLLAPLARAARRYWLPLYDATIGHRPWIVASADDPPERMVWRATGRYSASEAVDEIATALGLGDDHPVPFAAKWVGYDQGHVVLPTKA